MSIFKSAPLFWSSIQKKIGHSFMAYFLLLGTNQFAVVTDNRVQCRDNRKDNILTFIAIKISPQKTSASGKQMVVIPLQTNTKNIR